MPELFFLQINWADIGVIVAIALVFGLIIRKLHRDRKAGRCPGCGSCPYAEGCQQLQAQNKASSLDKQKSNCHDADTKANCACRSQHTGSEKA